MPAETGANARRACRDAAIRAQLERSSPARSSPDPQQLRRFLSFIVEQSLAAQGHTLKESVLAHELYGKGTDFDGGTDPVVRVDARRLRDKLREFYEGRCADPIVISLPKGSYVPVFEGNSASPADRLLSASRGRQEHRPVTSDARETVARRSRAHRDGSYSGDRMARASLAGSRSSPACFPWPRTQVKRGRRRCRRTAILSPSPGRAPTSRARRISM